MSASCASRSLANRLVRACKKGDLRAAKRAVADGASVNENWRSEPPLTAAARKQRHDVVVWLLSHGADPNGDDAMESAAFCSSAGILQLLIDAGGDVYERGYGVLLFPALWGNRADCVRVLLGQPCLDIAFNHSGKTPEQYERQFGEAAVADMMAQEVSGELSVEKCPSGSHGLGRCGRQRVRRATLVRLHIVRLVVHGTVQQACVVYS